MRCHFFSSRKDVNPGESHGTHICGVWGDTMLKLDHIVQFFFDGELTFFWGTYTNWKCWSYCWLDSSSHFCAVWGLPFVLPWKFFIERFVLISFIEFVPLVIKWKVRWSSSFWLGLDYSSCIFGTCLDNVLQKHQLCSKHRLYTSSLHICVILLCFPFKRHICVP